MREEEEEEGLWVQSTDECWTGCANASIMP